MIPQPVSVAAKEIAPPYAINPPPAAATIDFSQFLSDDSVPSQLPTAAQGTTASDAVPHHLRHDRNKVDDASAAAAAAALVPVPTQIAVPKSTATTATTSAAPSSGTTSPAPLTILPAGGSQSNTTANNGNGGNPQNGQTTPQPPGAAELEARISVGAPTYLTPPNTAAFAGLWHHAGTAPNASPAGEAADSDASGPPSAEDASSAPTVPGKLSMPEAVALAAAHGGAGDGHADAQAGADPLAAPAPTTAAAAAAAVGDSTTPAAASLPVADGGATQVLSNPQGVAAQPTAPAQVLPAYEQVAVNLRQAAQNGADHIEIQLKPASLGAIHVKLDVTHDGHITAVISADRSDTLNMLRQDSSGLEQALRDAGLQTNSGSLSFNLHGDAQSFAQNSQSSSGSSPSSDGSESQSGTDTPQPRYRRHDGALDIEV